MEKKTDIKIINLSSKNLTETEKNILKKGLKFTPTPSKKDTEELKKDISEFTRKIRLAEFFHNTETNDISIIRNKSDYTPPKKRNPALDTFAENIANIQLKTSPNPHTRQNISKNERDAIKSLAEDISIIIKQADKGGAVVLMNKNHYVNMAEAILLDGNYYEQLETNPQKRNKLKYNQHINKHSKCMTKKELKFLKEFEIRESQFYGLPKVHKSQRIKLICETTITPDVTIPNVTDLKLRPIIAGPSCLTNRLSNFLDILLKPITKQISSHLKDTTDFLRKLPDTTKDNTILVTCDIESLYSNISHELGLEALEFWLDRYPDTIPSRFTKEFLLDSMKFILQHNTFQFNELFFRQIRGTAMGTKVAPTYATLTIGFLEEKLYKSISEKFGEENGKIFKDSWKRYLDDCFLLWSQSQGEVSDLHNILNSLHQHINFTMEINTTSIPFLDCLIQINGTKISTDIYYKPTDSKTYLLFSSCHPKHTKISIPFSLARRLKTIVSNPVTLETRFQELTEFLKKQKYPPSLIEGGINKIKNISRENLLRDKGTEENNTATLAFITTHNPLNPDVFRDIKQDLNILNRDPHMREVLGDFSILKSVRQPPNLKKLLTRAKFTAMTHTPTHTVTRCNRPNCGLCSHLLEGNSFTFKCGKTVTTKFDMSCDVKNVIYVIVCQGCQEEYIGETQNLRERMRVHRQHIRQPETRTMHVSQHIDQCTQTQPKFKTFPIFKMTTTDTATRRSKEIQLIKCFKPTLNRRDLA